MSLRKRATCIASAISVALGTLAWAVPPLTVEGAKPRNVRISTAEVTAGESLEPEPVMLARCNGVIDLTAAEIETFRKACKTFRGSDGSWDAATRLAFVTCEASGKSGAMRSTYQIRRTDRGIVLVRGNDGPTTWTVDAIMVPRKLLEIAGLAAVPESPDAALIAGKLVQVEATSGVLHISPTLVKQRLFANTSITTPDTVRDLSTGRVVIRLPKSNTREMYCGLLVWVHAGDDAVLPESLFDAADTLGLVLATQVDAGNGTPLVTRMQRISDTLATVAERVHVDLERVYIGGISGGGKISLMYTAAFPEAFSGALCVVGFGAYEKTENREGIGEWPALFARPSGEQWKSLGSAKLAAVTGNRDFNYGPIKAAVEVFVRDGLNCKLFDVPGLAHAVPESVEMMKAMSWIDERGRAVRATEESEAAELLSGEGDARKAKLMKAIEQAPFSAAAWKAMDELRK